MSVWPTDGPLFLGGTDGELVSVRITIEPRLLEKLLDVLARLDFPINPQLYHDAATIHSGFDGAQMLRPAAVVEFPAWAGRLEKLRGALLGSGFQPECLSAKAMLEDIRSGFEQEPAPPGAPYKTILRSKHAPPRAA